jgi:hypothetical protein
MVMPYKDPDKHREHAKLYRDSLTRSGYGKVLYARRKQHRLNEMVLREAAEYSLRALDDGNTRRAKRALTEALALAPDITGLPTRELAQVLGVEWEGAGVYE